jgi:hypothetical protein
MDLRVMLGDEHLAISMGQRSRPGRKSQLRQLDSDILRFIVTLLDRGSLSFVINGTGGMRVMRR